MSLSKEKLWEKQGAALRDSVEIFGTSCANAGITADTIKYKPSQAFMKLLHRLSITLIISREYENFLQAFTPDGLNKIKQSFFHLPHPSGVVVNRKTKKMYVASTRNPNYIMEFSVAANQLHRIDKSLSTGLNPIFMPVRAKYYPGEYYFHDLAIVGGDLYANSVGTNSIVKVDFSNPSHEKPLWWPKCIESGDKPDFKANYIQLNSMATGKSLDDSYFTASGSIVGKIRPGHPDYPVDKRGVLISAKTREVVGKGLTRPHSARIYKNKVWVANSGYGEIGYFDKGKFKVVFKTKGWTRGLCFVGDVLFAGVSRVLPRFKQYAPGLKSSEAQTCMLVAYNLKTNRKIGEMEFPFGNQIFAIDYIDAKQCSGFSFTQLQQDSDASKKFSTLLV